MAGRGWIYLIGAALVVAAAVCYSVYITVSGTIVRQVGPLVSTGWITAGATGYFLVVGAATHSLAVQLPPFGGWILAGMVVFNTILPLVAFLAGLVRIGPTAASLISTLEPVFTVLLAAVFLGEHLGGLEAVGGLMVVSAAILVNLPPVRLGRESVPAGSGPKADHDM